MEHLAAVMLLLACPEDVSQCAVQPAPTVAYETMQECENTLAGRLLQPARGDDALIGTCLPVDPAEFAEDADIDWTVNSDRTITAQVVLVNPDVPDTVMADAGSLDQSIIMSDAVFETGSSAKAARLHPMPVMANGWTPRSIVVRLPDDFDTARFDGNLL